MLNKVTYALLSAKLAQRPDLAEVVQRGLSTPRRSDASLAFSSKGLCS